MKVLRTLTRVFLPLHALDEAVRFYEALFNQRARLRFPYPAARLELVEVDGVLLIAGDDEALAPYRETRATFVVDSLEEFRAALGAQGIAVLQEPVATPVGAKMRVRHPDGMVVEYVEHARPTAGCHDEPAAVHAPPRRTVRLEVPAEAAVGGGVSLRSSPRTALREPEDSCDVL